MITPETISAKIRDLLATDPDRVLAVVLLTDVGPARDELGRLSDVKVRSRINPLLLASALENAVAQVLSSLPQAAQDAYMLGLTPDVVMAYPCTTCGATIGEHEARQGYNCARCAPDAPAYVVRQGE